MLAPLTVLLSAFSAAELSSTEHPLSPDPFLKDAFEMVHHTSVIDRSIFITQLKK